MKRFAVKMLAVAAVAAALSVTPNVSDKVGTNVTAEAAKVKLNKKKETLTVGQKTKLKVKGIKKGTKVKWSSSKKKVASVSKKGVVTAKKAGKAVITAKVGSKKYKCKITVTAASAVAAPITPQTETPQTETPQTEPTPAPITESAAWAQLANYVKDNATAVNDFSEYYIEKDLEAETFRLFFNPLYSDNDAENGFTIDSFSDASSIIIPFMPFKDYTAGSDDNTYGVAFDSEEVTYGSYASLVKELYTKDSNCEFFISSGDAVAPKADAETTTRANSFLKTVMHEFSEIVHEAGLTMSDLGFTSYEN